MTDTSQVESTETPIQAAEKEIDAQHKQQQYSQNYRDTLSKELRGAPALQGVDSVEALATAYVEQQAHLGRSIRIPGPDASDEQRAEFFQKVVENSGGAVMPRPDADNQEAMGEVLNALGRPAEAKDYKAPEVENFNSERFETVKPLLHELGLTQSQAEGLARWQHEQDVANYNAAVERLNQNTQALKSEWGEAYQPRIDQLKLWLKRDKAPEDIAEAVDELPMEQTKFLWDLYNRMGAAHEGNEGGQHSENQYGITPAEARERANDLMARLASMLPSDPNYQTLVNRRLEMMKLANPNASHDFNDLRASSGAGSAFVEQH